MHSDDTFLFVHSVLHESNEGSPPALDHSNFAMKGAAEARMAREVKQLTRAPPEGSCVWCVASSSRCLRAAIDGPQRSPYEDGTFELQIDVPERYPFEPPVASFITPVYHPNIDSAGRICLDMLKPLPNACSAFIELGCCDYKPSSSAPQ